MRSLRVECRSPPPHARGASSPCPGVLAQAPREAEPDVVYVPTPQPVVDAMLELAQVKQTDVVYDLGSGDGRIVITAAKKYGARGVGIELDPALVKKARTNAAAAGVSDRVRFVTQNLFTADLSRASGGHALPAAEHQRAAAAEAGARAEAGHARRVARLQHGTGVAAGETS